MAKFRKKPVVIEAIKHDGFLDEQREPWKSFLRAGDAENIHQSGSYIIIETLEGRVIADRGDWIIRGVEGELYPCKPSVFAKTYEEVKPGD